MRMKIKILSSLLVPFAAISSTLLLGSCGEKNQSGPTTVYIDYGYYSNKTYSTITELGEMTYEELAKKIEYKESFAIALYIPGGCGCWEQFSEILGQYLNTSHIQIPYISLTKFEGKATFGLNLSSSITPSIAIFNNGQLVLQHNHYDGDERIFNRLDYFTNFMNSVTYSPVMYKVDPNTIDYLISTNDEFNIMFSRYTCPDCNNLKDEVLKPWIMSFAGTNIKKLYVFDDQNYTSEQRSQFKDKYGVSNVNNPTLGWNTGYVPSIQHRKGSNILDMITVNNDSLRAEGKTYFTADRLQYLTFLKDDATIQYKVLDDGFDELYGSAEYRKTYHNPISRLFLKTYCE